MEAVNMAYLILIPLMCLFASAESRKFLASSSSGQMSLGQTEHTKVEATWNTIWTFWDSKSDPSPFEQLNFETWKKHAPGMKVVFLNNTNVKDYVPDLPNEYYRLPYNEAKSDLVRAAVIYHHGGVFMDTDFMLMKPLAPLLERLETTDVIGYSDEGHLKSGDCGTHYSFDFLAGKKGNGFSKTWWHNIRSKLTRTCEHGEFACEKVCCNEKGGPKVEKRSCHIPWGQLSQLKMPWEDADRKEGGPDLDATQPTNKLFIKDGKTKCRDLHIGSQHDASTATMAENIPDSVKTYCLKGEESMTPHYSCPYFNGHVYWQPWDHRKNETLDSKLWKMKEYERKKFHCKLNKDGAMECAEGKSHDKFLNFFNRTAYHLFFCNRAPPMLVSSSKDAVLEGDWVISEMYRRSLGHKKI